MFEETSVSDMMKPGWKTVPDRAQLVLAELSCCAWLGKGSFVGRLESRLTVGVHDCLNTAPKTLVKKISQRKVARWTYKTWIVVVPAAAAAAAAAAAGNMNDLQPVAIIKGCVLGTQPGNVAV